MSDNLPTDAQLDGIAAMVAQKRSLHERIRKAQRTDTMFTPTAAEWRDATPYERRFMTWPQNILDAIRRERP